MPEHDMDWQRRHRESHETATNASRIEQCYCTICSTRSEHTMKELAAIRSPQEFIEAIRETGNDGQLEECARLMRVGSAESLEEDDLRDEELLAAAKEIWEKVRYNFPPSHAPDPQIHRDWASNLIKEDGEVSQAKRALYAEWMYDLLLTELGEGIAQSGAQRVLAIWNAPEETSPESRLLVILGKNSEKQGQRVLDARRQMPFFPDGMPDSTVGLKSPINDVMLFDNRQGALLSYDGLVSAAESLLSQEQTVSRGY